MEADTSFLMWKEYSEKRPPLLRFTRIDLCYFVMVLVLRPESTFCHMFSEISSLHTRNRTASQNLLLTCTPKPEHHYRILQWLPHSPVSLIFFIFYFAFLTLLFNCIFLSATPNVLYLTFIRFIYSLLLYHDINYLIKMLSGFHLL